MYVYSCALQPISLQPITAVPENQAAALGGDAQPYCSPLHVVPPHSLTRGATAALRQHRIRVGCLLPQRGHLRAQAVLWSVVPLRFQPAGHMHVWTLLSGGAAEEVSKAMGRRPVSHLSATGPRRWPHLSLPLSPLPWDGGSRSRHA
ncbi:hypothetical protein NDU88_001702 [Pleurodeles waltl]|uniref:Uncharacterized protein n=1 Tax=Pleurodeles waltl TaxID=8319 RepID=A0AAV7RDK6_PLEWA|nr:hypothetical protein NDU88_001702 [Pleurodeles waltl]